MKLFWQIVLMGILVAVTGCKSPAPTAAVGSSFWPTVLDAFPDLSEPGFTVTYLERLDYPGSPSLFSPSPIRPDLEKWLLNRETLPSPAGHDYYLEVRRRADVTFILACSKGGRTYYRITPDSIGLVTTDIHNGVEHLFHSQVGAAKWVFTYDERGLVQERMTYSIHGKQDKPFIPLSKQTYIYWPQSDQPRFIYYYGYPKFPYDGERWHRREEYAVNSELVSDVTQ